MSNKVCTLCSLINIGICLLAFEIFLTPWSLLEPPSINLRNQDVKGEGDVDKRFLKDAKISETNT